MVDSRDKLGLLRCSPHTLTFDGVLVGSPVAFVSTVTDSLAGGVL